MYCVRWAVASGLAVSLIAAAASANSKARRRPLAWRGWRLFSDEMAVFSFEDGRLRPNPRPVSLKNNAVGVIATFEPKAHMSRIYRGTPKGDIGFMRPPAEAVARAQESAIAGLVVTPKFTDGATTNCVRLDKIEAFKLLTSNAVNYASMLQAGFEMLTGIVERCGAYQMTYSSLDAAVELIDRLHRESLSTPTTT